MHKEALTEADTASSPNNRMSMELCQEFMAAKREKNMDLRNNHEDPFVRMLAIFRSDTRVDIEPEVLASQKKQGDIPEILELLDRIEFIKNFDQQYKTLGVGKAVKDFTAKDPDRNEFHLTDVLAKKEYTLVEFWASWCGPCRVEVPHMKKVYSHFNGKGFEIVSFSIGHKEEAWKKASREVNIPWINTVDLLARTRPVVKLCGVGGRCPRQRPQE